MPEFIKLFRNRFWADENLMAVKCFLCVPLKRDVGRLFAEQSALYITT